MPRKLRASQTFINQRYRLLSALRIYNLENRNGNKKYLKKLQEVIAFVTKVLLLSKLKTFDVGYITQIRLEYY